MGRWIARGLTLLALAASSQTQAAEIRYKVVFNGHDVPEDGIVVVEASGDLCRIHVEEPGTLIATAPVEARYVDFGARSTIQLADLRGDRRISVTTPFAELPVLTLTDEYTEILGYRCRRAMTVVRSNAIDVWFTEDLPVRGTPVANLVPESGVVLKVVRNGSHETVATLLVLEGAPTRPSDWGEPVDLPTYRFLVSESYVQTIQVFNHEQIFWGKPEPNPTDETAVHHYAGGTLIARRVTLPRVDADYAIFAELVQYSNGDAYDRTGSIFLIPTDRARSFLDALRDSVGVLPELRDRDGRTYQGVVTTEEYTAPLELIRFITPFGVRHYNSQVTVRGQVWEDSVLYKQDLTDFLPVLQGEVWIGAFIGNYDGGGHRLSLRLRYHPGSRVAPSEAEPRSETWLAPLFNTTNVLEMAGQSYSRLFETDSLRVSFEVPVGLSRCTLRYLTTGHGGWENGDEFLPKVNEIFLDGRLVARFVPWRTDCGSYRRWNPASGNFWNGLSSSDLTRSGWCPGAAVSPMLVPLGALTPGRHEITVAIPQGAPDGSSASAWNVSGVMIGER